MRRPLAVGYSRMAAALASLLSPTNRNGWDVQPARCRRGAIRMMRVSCLFSPPMAASYDGSPRLRRAARDG